MTTHLRINHYDFARERTFRVELRGPHGRTSLFSYHRATNVWDYAYRVATVMGVKIRISSPTWKAMWESRVRGSTGPFVGEGPGAGGGYWRDPAEW